MGSRRSEEHLDIYIKRKDTPGKEMHRENVDNAGVLDEEKRPRS
jgi:hypothetical protein